jgi:hypothetical protein
MTAQFPQSPADGTMVSIGDTIYKYDTQFNKWSIQEKTVERIQLDSTLPVKIGDPVSEDEITYGFTIQGSRESVHTVIYNVVIGLDEDNKNAFFINGGDKPNPELSVYRGYRYVFKFEQPMLLRIGDQYAMNAPFRASNFKEYEDGIRVNDDQTEYYFHVPLDAPDLMAYTVPTVSEYPFIIVRDYYKYK